MIDVAFFDILLILILFGWCYARIIQKDILNTSKIEGKDFAKLTIITGAFLVLILFPYVQFTSLNLMLGIFLVSILWIFEQFPKFIAIKKEEVSRLSTFSHLLSKDTDSFSYQGNCV